MNKASGGNRIPTELFQFLKDDAVKMLHSMHQQIWKAQQWPRTGRSQLSFQYQRRAMPKNVQATIQLHSFHMLGEGNGTPLQYCCPENPMDGRAWWAAVHGVAKSQT